MIKQISLIETLTELRQFLVEINDKL